MYKRLALAVLTTMPLCLMGFDTALFNKMISEETPEWMVARINQDLEPFTKQLSCRAIDAVFARDSEEFRLGRVQVINGALSLQKSKSCDLNEFTNIIYAAIERLHAMAPLPDLDFVFTALDTYRKKGGMADPIFTESKCVGGYGILFPDRWAIKGYEPEKSQVLEGNRNNPWDSKTKKLFFRGSDTGAQQNPNTWASYPRPRLVGLSSIHPDKIDAKFVNSLHYTAMLPAAKSAGWISGFVSMQDHMRYRYLMDLDGNCASCPRSALLMHCNSVVLKHTTDSIQWWYDCIKPFVHFIPVEENLSDILEKIEWAKNHDSECQKISENARKLAAEILSIERIYHYFYALLVEYSKRQKSQYDARPYSAAITTEEAKEELAYQYQLTCNLPSDINEHSPVLRRFASQCQSVADLGVGSVVSSWALIQGLAENPNLPHSYLGVHLGFPQPYVFKTLKMVTEASDISFDYSQGSDIDIEISDVDLLFIDTLHTYVHLTHELEKFSPQTNKYIILHDTSETFEYQNCASYRGNYSEYPAHIDRNKRGLWPAVQDFLARHPEWVLCERHPNNNGLTVLKRISG